MKNEVLAECYAVGEANAKYKPYSKAWYYAYKKAFDERMEELEPSKKDDRLFTESEVLQFLTNGARYIIEHEFPGRRLSAFGVHKLEQWFHNEKLNAKGSSL